MFGIEKMDEWIIHLLLLFGWTLQYFGRIPCLFRRNTLSFVWIVGDKCHINPFLKGGGAPPPPEGWKNLWLEGLGWKILSPQVKEKQHITRKFSSIQTKVNGWMRESRPHPFSCAKVPLKWKEGKIGGEKQPFSFNLFYFALL